MILAGAAPDVRPQVVTLQPRQQIERDIDVNCLPGHHDVSAATCFVKK